MKNKDIRKSTPKSAKVRKPKVPAGTIPVKHVLPRGMVRAAKYLLAISLATAIVFGILLLDYATTPIDRDQVSVVTVEIPVGSSFLRATKILDEAGLIRNRFLFHLLAFAKRATRVIRAGEYEFNTMMTPSQIIRKLVRGEIKTYKVSIPEDLNMKEIAQRLDDFKLIDREVFSQLARDKQFLNTLGIPADSIEGYLFPDTYQFTRSMSTREIMKIMVSQFWKNVTPEMVQKANEMGFTVHQLVTLASLIGKESGYHDEKELISAVFHNRLKKNKRLQSDPTAVYDLENFQGKILLGHLKRKSPYNTYLIDGLPPGPIANPGLASIKAALNPAPVKYLYFVSKNDGTHAFAETLQEHNENVKALRRLQQQARRQTNGK